MVQDIAAGDVPAADELRFITTGWLPITSGSTTNDDDVDIDATGGGQFPAGTFDAMRLHLWGRLDGGGHVSARFNGDSTSDRYSTGLVTTDLSDNTDLGEGVHNTDASHIRFAFWGNLTACTATLTLHHTSEVALIGWESVGIRPTGLLHSKSQGGGRTNAAISGGGLLTSIRLIGRFGGTSDQFTALRWILEGYRL